MQIKNTFILFCSTIFCSTTATAQNNVVKEKNDATSNSRVIAIMGTMENEVELLKERLQLIMLFEPGPTLNTGNIENDFTRITPDII